jgi:hypothetical protein
MYRSVKIVLGIITLLFITSCNPWLSDEQSIIAEPSILLTEDQSLGQTFVAHYNGLQGIEIHLSPSEDFEGNIRIHLRKDPDANQDLTSSIPTKDVISEPGFYRFLFEPQVGSTQRYYYLFIELTGLGNVAVGSANGEAYLDGAMYQNHQPLDRQMTFHLIYEPFFVLRGLSKEIISWLGLLLVAGFLFLLPGLAFLIMLFPKFHNLSIFSRLGLASGISLALYPILFLWTDLIGLHLGSLYAWLLPILSILYLLWRFRSWRPSFRIKPLLHKWSTSTSTLPILTLLFVTGSLLFLRLFLIRSLDVPLWGDSVHHTMISQLLVQNEGLFDSWEPLADLESLTYHFGFHANTAVFHWITGKSLPQSVLWTGQIVSFLAIFSLYPMVQKARGGRWGGILTLMIAGFLSAMPNFYLNWGRYTQLGGLAILPTAVFLIWESMEDEVKYWPVIGLTCITLAGLGLTHYRVLIFALIFFIPAILMNLSKRNYLQLLKKVSVIGLGAGLIFLPWFIHTFQGRITTNFLRSLTIPATAATEWTQQYNAIGDLTQYLPAFLWIFLAIAALLAFIKRMRGAILILIWWILILLATNPQWIHLPGEGAISNFAYFIAAYIPCSLVIGIVSGQILGNLSPIPMRILFILLGCLSIVGIHLRLKDLDVSNHALATRPDLHASKWIQENTDPQAKFLTNAFFAYNDTVIVGSDGGWWLRMLANRDTTLPPTSYGTEKGPRPDYRVWTNALYVEVNSKGITHPDVLEMLEEREVNHIYIGQRSGRVNYAGSDLLPIDLLLTDQHFKLVYHEDRVWIFKIL